jgi:hypothetical protein
LYLLLALLPSPHPPNPILLVDCILELIIYSHRLHLQLKAPPPVRNWISIKMISSLRSPSLSRPSLARKAPLTRATASSAPVAAPVAAPVVQAPAPVAASPSTEPPPKTEAKPSTTTFVAVPTAPAATPK